MKLFTAAAFALLLPSLAFSQATVPPPEAPTKPKPFIPIVAAQHDGPGRIGVRLVFMKDTDIPQIAGLTKGGPAADAGLKIGDIIIKIDKNYTSSLSEDDARLALHGQPGTGVELTIQRGDDPKFIVRAMERRVIPGDTEEVLNPDTDSVDIKQGG